MKETETKSSGKNPTNSYPLPRHIQPVFHAVKKFSLALGIGSKTAAMRIRQSCLPVRGISNLLVAEKLKIKREYLIKPQKQGSLISTRLPRYRYRLPGIRYEEHLYLFNTFPQVQEGIQKQAQRSVEKTLYSSVYLY